MTSEEAIALVGYLRHAFGGYTLSPDEERPYLRLFRRSDQLAVRNAIDDLVRTASRRPSPNEIAQQMAKRRPVPSTQSAEEWPEITPEDVARHIAECRAMIR